MLLFVEIGDTNSLFSIVLLSSKTGGSTGCCVLISGDAVAEEDWLLLFCKFNSLGFAPPNILWFDSVFVKIFSTAVPSPSSSDVVLLGGNIFNYW